MLVTISYAAGVMPMLVITQPINALAFVADGALFGKWTAQTLHNKCLSWTCQ